MQNTADHRFFQHVLLALVVATVLAGGVLAGGVSGVETWRAHAPSGFAALASAR